MSAINIPTSNTYSLLLLFFFNDPATTEIYTLSLHDALPIYQEARVVRGTVHGRHPCARASRRPPVAARSAHRRGSPWRRRQVLYERHHGYARPPRDAVPRSADVVQAQGGGPLASVRLGDHGRLLVTDEAGGVAQDADPRDQR